MTDRRVLLARITDEGPSWSPEAVSLMTGASPDEIRAAGVSSIEALPVEWLKAGRRRSAEARAVTGTNDALTALRYWAAKEFNRELIMEDAALYMEAL